MLFICEFSGPVFTLLQMAMAMVNEVQKRENTRLLRNYIKCSKHQAIVHNVQNKYQKVC